MTTTKRPELPPCWFDCPASDSSGHGDISFYEPPDVAELETYQPSNRSDAVARVWKIHGDDAWVTYADALLMDRDAEAKRADFLARLVGGAIVRASCIETGETVVESDPEIAGHALTQAVERLRARAEKAESERESERDLASINARRSYAKVWSKVTRNKIDAIDFTPDRLRAELGSRWLERRVLSDGAVPAVGQRVVTVREVAEKWGLTHGHDDLVHEITSLLGGDCNLVECGPRQIGMAMLRLAPAGSDVTCPHCRGWHDQREKWTIDAKVYREAQFKVRDLTQRIADLEKELLDLKASSAESEAIDG